MTKTLVIQHHQDGKLRLFPYNTWFSAHYSAHFQQQLASIAPVPPLTPIELLALRRGPLPGGYIPANHGPQNTEQMLHPPRPHRSWCPPRDGTNAADPIKNRPTPPPKVSTNDI